MSSFYSIPFGFEKLLKNETASIKVGLDESIRQHIQLIITTRLGSFRYDPAYGCKIWDVDFEVPSNLESWKEEIKLSIQDAILKHEKRIQRIETFSIQINRLDQHGLKRIQQRLDVHIQGYILGTTDEFEYEDSLYFCPVSLV